jgi:apolipoprotein N-acyltransferase
MIVLLLCAPLLQPQFVVVAAVRQVARRSRAGAWRIALTGACAYIGAEWVVPKLFADTLGHGLYASALLRQGADIAGASGLTFVLLLANEGILTSLRALRAPAPRRALAIASPACCVAALALALLGHGIARERTLAAPIAAAPVRAALVQGDISHYDQLAHDIGTYDAVRHILDVYFEQSAGLLGRGAIDLLVWPETVYPTTFGTPKSADGATFDRAIAGFVDHSGVPLVFGSYDVEGGSEFNAAVFLAPSSDGRPRFETYRKASLFPLTERVPMAMDFPFLRRWLPWLGTWMPGRGAEVVTVRLRDGRDIRVAPLICYDAVDPRLALGAVRAGAELIITLSNDSWFASGGGPRLHLVVSAFRSIETRRPQLRATNTGISAIIAPDGELLGSVGVGERGTLSLPVTPMHGPPTLMVRWGDWFGPTALAAALVLFAIAVLRTRSGD